MVVNTWDNDNTDNLWSEATNWSLNHVPLATEDVVIPDTSILGKCTMDENSAADLGSLEVQVDGELEGVTFTLDVNGDITLTGTFTRGTGTLQLGGGGVQNVTSGGNALYHVITTGAGTIYYTKDDTEIFDIDIQANTTFEVDAVSEGAALSISLSDIANAGFKASAGSLLCQGSGANGVTVTSTGAPPTNYWGFDLGIGCAVTMDYTIIEYHDIGSGAYFAGFRGVIDIDNCTFQNGTHGGVSFYTNSSITSFTNNTLNNCQIGIAIKAGGIYRTLNNITIANMSLFDIEVRNSADLELIDSDFDITKTQIGEQGYIISKNHNGVAGTWNYWATSTINKNKSDFTNDFTSSDNVTIQTGTLTVDEAAAHNDLTIKSGGTFDVNGGITQTITNTGTITIESGGTLEWTGSAGSLISLRSDVAGTPYSLNVEPGGISQARFVNVQDCDASGGNPIDATDDTSVDSLRNKYWRFPNRMVGHLMSPGIDLVGIPMVSD